MYIVKRKINLLITKNKNIPKINIYIYKRNIYQRKSNDTIALPCIYIYVYYLGKLITYY